MATITLDFEGYYLDEDSKVYFPEKQGIYCVYKAIHNKEKDTVSLKELIYIGESENLNERITSHEKWDNWKKKLEKNHCLVLTYATTTSNRERAEKVLIYNHEPICNEKNTESHNVTNLIIKTKGKNSHLEDEYEV